jgi:hypothetical protein
VQERGTLIKDIKHKTRVFLLRKHTDSAIGILEKVGPRVHFSKVANEYNHMDLEIGGRELQASGLQLFLKPTFLSVIIPQHIG